MKKLIPFFALAALIIAASCSGDYPGGYYGGYDGEYTASGDKFTDYDENQFVSAEETPTSTFSVDADGASYAIARNNINYDRAIPSASVRIEEYLNYFTFDYAEPKDDHLLSVESEISVAPWNEEHYIVRFGIKGKTTPKEQLPPSNYVFLVDVSGSMSSEDKIDLAKAGFTKLANNLRDDDRVTIITYSGKVKMLLEPTLGKDKKRIKSAISKLSASGSTNGGNAIQMAYEAAEEYYVKGGNNRIILATDGDFNVGVTDTDELINIVEKYLDKGIYLTVLGFGYGNLNDGMMEQIANKGNGNYEYIDNSAQIEKVFINEITKLYTVAKDAKIQLTFNPNSVSQYRLIGYENRVMNNEDFDDSSKDAGEIGVGQTITAIYEIIPNEIDGNNDITSFAIKYKDVNAGTEREINHTVTGDYATIKTNTLSENQRFASAVTMFGLLLKNSEFKGNTTKELITDLAEKSLNFDPYGYRAEFINLVNNAIVEDKKDDNDNDNEDMY